MNPLQRKGQVAVITGASSGIGEATARKFASHGMQVVLVARREQRLESLAESLRSSSGSACVMAADLSQAAERERICRTVEARYGTIDVLVNNAGLAWYGYGMEMSWETAWEILAVNVEAVVQLSLSFLKKMKAQNHGHIINVGSISGSLPSQGVAVYGASKSFLDNFSTALYRELSGTPIHVSVVRAGPVLTELSHAASRRLGGLPLPTGQIGVKSAHVARRIWDLLLKPRRVIYVPEALRIIPWLELSFGWIIDRLGPRLLKAQPT